MIALTLTPRLAAGDPSAAAADRSDCADEEPRAAARRFELGAQLDLDARFIWRGLAGSRSAAFQPSARAAAYGLRARVWSSITLVYEPPHGRFTLSALQPSVAYTVSLGALELQPAVAYYHWGSDESPRSTAEAALGLSYRLGAVRLLSANDVDIDSHPGAYFGTLGFEYERSRHRWTIAASVDFGWATSVYNRAYFARSLTTIDVIEASVSARYGVTDTLYFAIHFDASTLVALELQRSVQEPTLMTGGVALGLDY